MQMRGDKWSVLLLASILLLGNMGLSSTAFAAGDKLESITISYNIDLPKTIEVRDKKDNLILSEDLSGNVYAFNINKKYTHYNTKWITLMMSQFC